MAMVLVLVTGLARQGAAQSLPGFHPVSGRQYAQPMGLEGAPWLERRERVDEEDPDRALRLLRVAKGSTVADVGAGSGYFAVRLAKLVGPEGRVYASDIQPGMLELLKANVAKARVANVVPILGALTDPKLPANTMDLVIMVDVYHEFSQPQTMLARIRESLKPGGRLVLLEYRAEDPDVPIIPSHKMTKAQVKLEVEHEGFTQLRVYDDLPRQHLIVFAKP
jgi:ubiquinone/menaquinone biosynthesis C-methylase UbiE